MKICCYEEFITKSSGTTSGSDCRDFGRNQHPSACKGGKCALQPGNLWPKWVVWEGQVPFPFLHPPIQGNHSQKATRVDFCLFIGAGCSVAQRLLILRCLFVFLSDAPIANVTQSWEDGARTLSLAAFRNKSEGESCWCPLSSCAADLSPWLSCRAGIEALAPCVEGLIQGTHLLI